MTDNVERFERVRLLSRIGPDERYRGGELGYVELSEHGFAFWGQFSGARVEIPWAEVQTAQGMGLRTARRHVFEAGIQLDGVEPNFWTARPDGDSFLFLEQRRSPTLCFHFRGTPVANLQVRLRPFVSHLPDTSPPPPGVAATEAASAASLASFDLAHIGDTQRQMLMAQLVEQGLPHGWTGDTLSVTADGKPLVESMVIDLDEPEPPGPERADTTTDTETASIGSASTTHAPTAQQDSANQPGTASELDLISDQLSVLERLVALRDAGGLTPDEFEAARVRTARLLAQHND